jgi:formylmethanofuran dehydrogenase subunit E
MDDRQILMDALRFHGHKCWASVAGVRVGLAALRALGVKGNLRKQPYGKLAFTLIDKDSNRAVRVSYKPTLQKKIAQSAFMDKRAAGISPDDIPEAEQMELVDLVWEAPEADVLTVGQVLPYEANWLPEVMGFAPCAACGELTALAYLRVVGNAHKCIPCSGYDR